MDFDAIFNMLKIRKQSHFPISSSEAVDIIAKAYIDGNIDNEEKEMLLDLV